jgi:hypothetical protein
VHCVFNILIRRAVAEDQLLLLVSPQNPFYPFLFHSKHLKKPPRPPTDSSHNELH